MTPNPITVCASAPMKEAVAIMVERGVSAVPVVDEDGKPVGVLSQTDIVIHDHNKPAHAVPEYYTTTDAVTGGTRLLTRFPPGSAESTRVHELMTPTVFAVRPNDSVMRVVGDMVAFKIHRLFVVNVNGVLLGVISAFDVLRKLSTEN
jgi:CBS domain-containing protein